MTVRLLSAVRVAGALVPAGTVAAYDDALESTLVSNGKAIYIEGLNLPTRPAQNLRRGFPLLAYPRSSADHQAPVGFSGGGTPTSEYTVIDGVPVLRLTSNAGSYQFDVPVFAKQVPNGSLQMLVHMPNAPSVQIISVLLGVDGSFANHYVCNVSLSVEQWPGWHLITIDPPAAGTWAGLSADAAQRRWAIGTGTPDFAVSTFTVLRFRVIINTNPAVVSVAGIWITERNVQPSVVLVADDGYDTTLTAAAPIAEKYGLRISMGIIKDAVGVAGYMTLGQLQSMVDRGHECVVHGNPPGVQNLTHYSTTNEVYDDIVANQSFLVRNGLARNGSEFCYIYPQGIFQHSPGDTRIINAVKRAGMRLARITQRNAAGVVCPGMALDSWHLNEVGHRWDSGGETANVDRVILRMRQAVALGRSPILTFHKFESPENEVLDISPANFERICAAVADEVVAGNARNLLLSEMAAQISAAA
jgi:hypothetical protein